MGAFEMRNKVLLLMVSLFVIGLIAGCSDDEQQLEDDEELLMLEVDFEVPETADVGEAVELIADVTYGDEPVTDADEVLFEIWESGKEDESEQIDGNNEGDGTYTLEYTFDQDGIYEMYAHTTAHSMHNMPKKQIKVGDVSEDEEQDDSDEAFHTEGFDLHFDEPESVSAKEDTSFTTHITLHEEPLDELHVRYQIWPEGNEDETEWVDADEDNPGEYTGEYSFKESNTYLIQIHVEDDEDLHEHKEYTIEVE